MTSNDSLSEAPSSLPQAAQPAAPVSRLLGQHVLVLGLGQSGLAMARWCARAGAHVTVADTREQPPQLATLLRDLPSARFVSGPLDATLVQGTDVRAVFKSPGLSPADVAPLWDAARAVGLWLGTELSLFAHALSELAQAQGYAPKLLAIAGTNGKTTVTSLTGQLLARAGKTVAVAGNIGPTLLDTLLEKLQAQALPDIWVLELSSFQLDAVQDFEPFMGTVLNLTQDHLDWHGTMAAYQAAKAKVFGKHGLLLLNRDDVRVMALREPLAVTSDVPGKGRAARIQQRAYVSFGSDRPQRPGDFGLEEVNGMSWLVRGLAADEPQKKRRTPDDLPELHLQRLMPAGALRIAGRHNALNALAALALASSVGGSLASMLYGLRDYRGEPHRVEALGVLHEVEYFDDSKGTNVGATVAALQGLGVDRRVVLILGGDGKGQDFSPLAAPVTRYARAVLLIGRDASLLRAALASTGVDLLDAQSLPQAVQLAHQRAQPGDAVLLSPACASFDMFDNYAHRAQVFAQAVQALALDGGLQLETLA